MKNWIRGVIICSMVAGSVANGQEEAPKPAATAEKSTEKPAEEEKEEKLSTANTPTAWSHKSHSFERSVSKVTRLNYWLYLPRGHDPKSDYRYPLMLFLHGAGERGTDLEKVKVHGPPKVAVGNPKFRSIILSPQCPTGQTWDREAVMALLEDVMYRYRADPKRIYVTGLSMGGYGTWDLVAHYPDRFAAAVPICGGGSTIDIKLSAGAKREALKNLPVWVFHGAKDTVVHPYESQRMVDALAAIGSKSVKLTVYPEAGHDSWTATYANAGLYDWIMRQNLEVKKAPQ